MQKINFQNLPNTTTPLNAQNMNAIQDNAETAINQVASALNNLIQLGTFTDANGSFTIGSIGVEFGTVTVTPSSGSSPDYYGSTSVTFVNTYAKAPGMFANLGAGFQSVKNVATINVSTTGGNVWMTASAQTARTCRYFVIGELAD